MSSTTSLWIPGKPIAQPRAKATSINGKARMYQPKGPIAPYKQQIAIEARKFFNQPLFGPVRLVVQCYLPRPKAKVWKTKPMPREWHTSKPDIDNLAKAIMDALNGIAWNDDAQVCETIAAKYVSSGSEDVGVRIGIVEIVGDAADVWAATK